MDFITGALPNVMFIAGLIAIGLGLGIEFKIVEIKGELSKQGRLGAIGIGAVLVMFSIYLYTRPPQPASAPGTVPGAQPAVVQANAGSAGGATQVALAPAVATATPPARAPAAPPTATAVPPTPPPVPPTTTAVPPTATRPPPTATPVPPTPTPRPPTAVPSVKVPDIRGKSTKDAQKLLGAAGLRLGEEREQCKDIGAQDVNQKLKKGQIRCQSPAAGSVAAQNTAVVFVLEDGGSPHHD